MGLDAVRQVGSRVDKFGQGDRALKIDTLAVAVCVALLEHPYAFLAIREYRDERRQQSKRKASAKYENKQTDLLPLARVDSLIFFSTVLST
jgi:hypothetical protein